MAIRARAPSDVSTLLLELLRLVKALRTLPATDSGLRDLGDRVDRAFVTELSGAGPLDVEIRDGRFRLPGSEEVLGTRDLDDLARALEARGVTTLHFATPLRPGAVGALARALAEGDGPFPREPGGPGSGIRAEVPAGAEGSGAGAAGGLPLADLVAETLSEPRGAEAELKPDPPPREGFPGEPSDGIHTAGPAGHRDAAPEDLPTALARFRSLEAPEAYARGVEEIVRRARELAEAGDPEAAHPALLLFAEHARLRTPAGEPDRRAELAELALRALARGRQLEHLIDRALAPGPEGIAAGRILVQLGEVAGGAIFDRLEAESRPRLREELEGVLLALGRAAEPAVLARLRGPGHHRIELAARLAGALRCARAVPALVELLGADEPSLRSEAARALLELGDGAARGALEQAAEGSRPEPAVAAASVLAAAGSPRGLEVLARVLRRAVRDHHLPLALDAVAALGRARRPEGIPELERVLDRRSLLRRGSLRAIKLAVVEALAEIPGQAATEALGRAAENRERPIREAARRALHDRLVQRAPDPA